MRRRVCSFGLMLTLAPFTLAAQQTHVLMVAGLSGDPAFKSRFTSALTAMHTAVKTRWGVSDSSLIALTEDSTAFNGRSTRENIGKAFASLSRRVQPGDVLLVVLVGHGSGEGANSRVNLPGPDAAASEYASWLAPFARQQVVFVNAATGSGDFVSVLSAPGRIVVTATRSAVERNESEFLQYFARALATDDADANKDGRLSVLEAFQFARTEVTKSYAANNRMLTEHAVLSDSVSAARVAFGTSGRSSDPKVAALMAERQALESQVAALRARKAAMDVNTYEVELERLLLAIAEKSAAIRAAGGGK